MCVIFCQQLGCEVVELNVQADHVLLLVKIPPRISLSGLMGVLKGRAAIRLFSVFPFLIPGKGRVASRAAATGVGQSSFSEGTIGMLPFRGH